MPNTVSNPDDSWEDVSSAEQVSVKLENDPDSRPSSPRKKAARRVIPVNSPRKTRSKQLSKSPTPIVKQVKPEPDIEPVVTAQDAVRGLRQFTVFSFKYLVDVLSTSVYLMKKPLGIILFLYFLSFILARISSTLRTAFSPLCYIPGISRTPICWTASHDRNHRPPQWADYPKLMDVQSSTFEQLLDDAVSK